MSTKSREALLTVDFGQNGGTRIFRTAQDIRAFIEEQNGTAYTTALRSTFGGPTIQYFDEARTALDRFDRGEEDIEFVRTAFTRAFSDPTIAQPLPLMDSPDGLFLQAVQEKYGHGVMLGVVAHMFGPLTAAGDSPDIRMGILLGQARQLGLHGIDVSEFKKSFVTVQKQATREHGHFEQISATILADAEDRNSKLRLRAAKLFTRMARSRLEVARQLETKKSEAIDQLQKTEQTYRTQLGLQAPVEYWKEKSAKHATNSVKLRDFAAIYAVCSVIVAIIVLLLTAEALRSQTQFSPSTIAYGALGLLVTTVALWGGRILVRLYMSEHHLAIDAEERATMVHTFLALQLGGQVEAKDLQLILGPIFRPSADGIVKDDGAPDIGIASLLSKAASK